MSLKLPPQKIEKSCAIPGTVYSKENEIFYIVFEVWMQMSVFKISASKMDFWKQRKLVKQRKKNLKFENRTEDVYTSQKVTTDLCAKFRSWTINETRQFIFLLIITHSFRISMQFFSKNRLFLIKKLKNEYDSYM